MYAREKSYKLGVSALLALILAALFLSEPALSAPRTKDNGDSVEGKSRVAQNGKRKKKKSHKRRQKPDSAESSEVQAPESQPPKSTQPEDQHREQEGEADEPYGWDLSLLSDISVTNSKTGSAKSGSADYNLDLKALKILGTAFELGGEITYDESSFKTKESTNTSRTYVVSLASAYNFGDLNHDTWLFFILGNVGFGGGSDKVGDEQVRSKITQYGVGLGLHYFMDTNVALTTQFSYDAGSVKVSGADEATKFSTIHLARIGFSLFL